MSNNETKLMEDKEIVKLEKKIDDPGFISMIRTLSNESLNGKLLELTKHEQAIITSKNEDEALANAKDVVRELNAPYAETLKFNRLKKRFIALLLEEKEQC